MRLKKLNNQLLNLDKGLLSLNNRHFLLFDAIIFSLTPLLGISLRLDNLMRLHEYRSGLIIATFIFSLIKLIVFTLGSFYKRYWKYASIDELTQMTALTASAVIIEIIILSLLEYVFGLSNSIARVKFLCLIWVNQLRLLTWLKT